MSSAPIVLFGALDRHNLGDLLLGRAAALGMAPRSCLFAGLKAADMTALGGFPVAALADVLAGWRGRFGDASLDLLHVGGEVLDTDAWEAAVMLQEPDEAARLVARLDADPEGRAAWAAQCLGQGRPAPYVVGRHDLPVAGRLEFCGVGGVGLPRREPAFVAAVVRALASADRVSVRDARSREALAALGVAADLAPDPVAGMGDWLREALAGSTRRAGPYVAAQCAASFGDDATLTALAAALDRFRKPLLIFRAGAAPWHDDLAVCRRLASRLRGPAAILESLHVRDICAAIAGAEFCVASSLHALIVAGASGVEGLGLERRPGEGEKLRAYAETWGGFQVVTPDAV